MKFQFWKHHDNDRWYWSFTGGTPPIVPQDGFRTLDECMNSLLTFRTDSDWPEAGVEYRDKPGN